MFIGVAVAAMSCQVGRAEYNSKPTAYGATMFYYQVNYTFHYNQMLFDAVNLDIVAQTPLEKRDSVEDLLFPLYKVRIDGSIYKLTGNNKSYAEIQTNNQSIRTVGAKWNFNIWNGNQMEPGKATIECMSTNCWQVKMNQPKIKNLYTATVTAPGAAVNQPIQLVPLTITFDAELGYVQHYPENFYRIKTIEPLTIQYDLLLFDKYLIREGVIGLKYISINGQMLDEVKGTFSYPSSYQIVTIDYRQVTENWVWQSIPEYAYYY